MTCRALRQGDEYYCASCQLRWRIDEDTDDAPCEQAESIRPKDDVLLVKIAKCIIGPRMDTWIGREKLMQLRDHKWNKMTTNSERDDAILAARAIVKELDL